MAKTSKDKDVFNFKFFAKMEAFCLNVCDEKNNIAEIKVQGNGKMPVLFSASKLSRTFSKLELLKCIPSIGGL